MAIMTALEAILYHLGVSSTPGTGTAAAWNGTTLVATFPVAVKTANYPIVATDGLIICTTNAFTVTLPSAVDLASRMFIVKNANTLASGKLITMATTSAQTIDGSAPGTILPLSAQTFVSDGSNWWIT